MVSSGRARVLLAVGLCTVGLSAGSARANSFETFGFGPRASAMGGALTAEASDYSATFYNPAMLATRKDGSFGFSFQFYAMSAAVEKAATADSAKTLDCTHCTAPSTAGTSVGFATPLGGKLKNRVALGVGVYLPIQRLVRVQATDPEQPFWYHYNSQTERMSILVGLGIKITDWFTIGGGVSVLADLLGAGADVNVDLFNKSVKARAIDSHLSTRVAPIVGLHVAPIPALRFGVSYRGEIGLQYKIPASVNLEGIGTLGFVIEGLVHYSPHTITFGAAYDITKDFTVSLDGELALWAAAPSPYVSLVVDLSGDTLKALGLDKALDITSPSQPPGFANTFSARFGAEYRFTPRFTARAGGFYRPTPVPRQNVPGTNILDGNTLGLGAGLTVNFDDPLEIFASPINIDLALQGQFLFGRDAEKEATDSTPSYSYGSRVLGLTAGLRYDF